jgi:two-component system, OmpR family, sensor histidine kinase KdpD
MSWSDRRWGRSAGRTRVRVELPADVPLLEVDPIQVERALANLIENAIRFSPPAEEVVVVVSADATEVVIRVIDHGPGVDERDLERIFEPFEQSGEGDRHGTGLGLAISRGFANANGGSVRAESTPGKGASFVLTLPAAEVLPARL